MLTFDLKWDDEMAEKIQESVNVAALSAAEKVADDTKRLVADVAYDTGTLHDSIKAVKSKMKNGGAIVLFGSRTGTSKRGASGSGAGAFYAHMVEYGTVNMPKRPTLRPALYGNKDNTIEVIKNSVQAATK